MVTNEVNALIPENTGRREIYNLVKDAPNSQLRRVAMRYCVKAGKWEIAPNDFDRTMDLANAACDLEDAAIVTLAHLINRRAEELARK